MLPRALKDLIPTNEHTRVLLLGAVMGVIGGLSAGAFDALRVLVGWTLLGTANPFADPPSAVRAILGPAIGALVAGALIHFASRSDRPAGVPDVIASLDPQGQPVSARDGGASAGAAAIAVGSGLTAGREGPIVLLSSTVAWKLGQRFAIRPSLRRTLVAAAAAGGIAGSFQTPLGGAFFAMEVLLGSFAVESFAPIVVASVTGTVVGQVLLGERLALVVPAVRLGSPIELVAFPFLGVLCGAVAVVLRRLLRQGPSLLERIPLPPLGRAGLVGLGVGAIAAAGMPEVMGNGYEAAEALIAGDGRGVGALVLLLVVRGATTALTASSRTAGGLFAPALVLGAITGILFGTAVHGVAPTLVPDPGPLGTVGMGAVAAAVAHSPITISLMLFEMTGDYAVILPLLLTIAVASPIAKRIDALSVYQEQLDLRGIQLGGGREELVLYDLTVGDVARHDRFVTIGLGASVRALEALVLERKARRVWAVDEDDHVRGVIEVHELRELDDPSRTVAEVVRQVRALRAAAPLADAVEGFGLTDMEDLPVVDEDGRLVGILHENDVMAALTRELLRKEALLTKVRSNAPDGRRTDFVQLPEGQVIELVAVSGELAGCTLAELRLPSRSGCTVLAVDLWDPALGDWRRERARADLRVTAQDRLLVVGDADGVEKISQGERGEPTVVED